MLRANPALIARGSVFREQQTMNNDQHLDLLRDPATKLSTLEHPLELRSMRVWHCKYKSLRALADLSNLEVLVIGSLPDDSLEFLTSLKKLRYLKILHAPAVRCLGPLTDLSTLESLSLATSPAWDSAGKCLTVPTLEPLTKIASLKHLELFGVCASDKSLAVLEQCKNLQTARFSQYPKSEVNRYYAATRVKNAFNPEPIFL